MRSFRHKVKKGFRWEIRHVSLGTLHGVGLLVTITPWAVGYRKCRHAGAWAGALGRGGAPKGVPMLKRGQIIANRYVVKDIIGHGGMGRIYRVYDKALGEIVAMKTLLPKHVNDKTVMERFFNEARIARGLSHPNIVRVHDIGGTDSMVYISMEYLEGKSLRQLLDGLEPGKRLPINAILRMFDALCAALDYAHKFTVHRDIKPENVMILPDGSVRLMDFGISKLMSSVNVTSASVIMGTPRYMSPEQLENTSKVDARADIYSVGVMLYEVITGVAPSALGKTASETRREVPPALDPIIEKCVESNPAKRYQTAGELRDALREVRIAVETDSPPEKPVGAPATGDGGRGMRIAIGATIVVVILACAGFGITKAEERRHALIENAPGILPFTAPEIDIVALDFEDARALIEGARTKAMEAMENYPEEDRRGVLGEAISRGDDFWLEATALAKSETARALDLAADALSCFIAPTVWPEGMVFVPPGPVDLEDASGGGISEKLSAFFIDQAEVSMQEFSEFRERGKGWRWPKSAGRIASELPMTYVTYYDALAFTASQRPSKSLPSEAQWTRALAVSLARSALAPSSEDRGSESKHDTDADPAEEDNGSEFSRRAAGILYISGQPYFEWTSSPWTDFSAERIGSTDVTFRSPVVIRGGVFDALGHFLGTERNSMMYESQHQSLTFRGVMSLPDTLEGLARFAP